MDALLGSGLLAATASVILYLRPRAGRERWIVRIPGAWIILGLVLTTSVAGSAAMILTGIGILR